MRELFRAVPAAHQGRYAVKADQLVAPLAEEIRNGDVLMVKGSFGSKMGPVVEALVALGDDDSESILRNRG